MRGGNDEPPDELRQVAERIQTGWQGPSADELNALKRSVVVRAAEALIAGGPIALPAPELEGPQDDERPVPPAAPESEPESEPEPELPPEKSNGWSRFAIPAGVFLTIALVSGADGGYDPEAWGWVVLAFVWFAGLALVVRDRISVGSFEVATCAAIALLTIWIGVSIAWSDDVPQSVYELQRALVYLAGLVAAVVALRRRSLRLFTGGLLAGITAVCIAGLVTRFFPSEGVGSDSILQNRLSDPIGYWNALGIFAAMGVLLAVGLAAHGRRSASALPQRRRCLCSWPRSTSPTAAARGSHWRSGRWPLWRSTHAVCGSSPRRSSSHLLRLPRYW